MKHKKAFIISGTLAKLMLLVAAFIIIGAAITKIYINTSGKTDEFICRESVDFRVATATNAKLLGTDLDEVKYSPFFCKTIDRKISGTRDEVMDELSGMVEQCWWMFREGQVEDLFKNLPGTSGKNKGIVCYAAIIKDIEDDSVITGTELLQHMENKDHPKMAIDPETGKKGSYLDYIQYGKGPGRVVSMLGSDKNPEGVFREGFAYEIAFIDKGSDKNGWISDLMLGVGGAGTAFGAAALVFGSGGTVLIGGAVVTAAGILTTFQGGKIKWDEMFEQKDVSSIFIVDMSNTQLRNELHANTFLGDTGGQ